MSLLAHLQEQIFEMKELVSRLRRFTPSSSCFADREEGLLQDLKELVERYDHE